MQFHLADVLDRKGAYWALSPNRWQQHWEDVAEAPDDTNVLTVERDDANWQRMADLPSLCELSLYRPSQDQLALAGTLTGLTRLRVTLSRTKDLKFLAALKGVEELALEYVSGIVELSQVAVLPKLRSLHLENLRNVSDFSDLAGCKTLQYLSFRGTADKSQVIRNLDFLGKLSNLEVFSCAMCRVTEGTPRSLEQVPNLKEIGLSSGDFGLEEYAYLKARIPHVKGADVDAVTIIPASETVLHEDEWLSQISEEELREQYPGINVDSDGRRSRYEPEQTYMLGKGMRILKGTSEKVLQRRAEHQARFDELVRVFQKQA